MSRPYNVININGHIVPATYHDALKKILVAVKERRVNAKAASRYTQVINGQTCLCAIGALLSDAQLSNLGSLNLNGAGTDTLAFRIGDDNLQAMTSMRKADARTIQGTFDHNAMLGRLDRFEAGLHSRLAGRDNYPNPATERTGAWHFPVSGQ